MTPESAYSPLVPAKRPGGKPDRKPAYRVLVHRKYRGHWDELVGRVGLQQAQEFWEHLSLSPGTIPATAATTILRGQAGKPKGEGWSRTIHYELSSKARADYQFNDSFRAHPQGDAHKVVAILTINYSSH